MWQGTNVALDQRLYLHLSYTNVFVELVFTIQSSAVRERERPFNLKGGGVMVFF
jgi:hypothetical protein